MYLLRSSVITLVTLATLSALSAFAIPLPFAPPCPAGGIRVLPDTYPALAHVISDAAPPVGDIDDVGFTLETVHKLLGSAPLDATYPVILLPVRESTFQKIEEQVRAQGRPEWIQRLIHIDAPSWRWQQDYFESFFSPETGLPSLLYLQGYHRAANSIAALKAALNSLLGETPETGFALETSDPLQNSEMGGNIEALPGGFCLHGDNQPWEGFAERYCGDRNNEVVVPTSWLNIGHADELVSTIPAPAAAPECRFAIQIASPRKAQELLKASPDERFFEFAQASESETFAFTWPVQQLCRRIKYSQNSAIDCQNARQLLSVSNRDVSSLFKFDRHLRRHNRLAQDQLDRVRSMIAEKIRSRLPQCDVRFVEMPEIFLVKESSVGSTSLLPNPVNAVVSQDTVLVPHPQNSAFIRSIRADYARLGTLVDFVDTYAYAHLSGGNLHCATHSIRYCTPVK